MGLCAGNVAVMARCLNSCQPDCPGSVRLAASPALDALPLTAPLGQPLSAPISQPLPATFPQSGLPAPLRPVPQIPPRRPVPPNQAPPLRRSGAQSRQRLSPPKRLTRPQPTLARPRLRTPPNARRSFALPSPAWQASRGRERQWDGKARFGRGGVLWN